jgi:hypothetical protein
VLPFCVKFLRNKSPTENPVAPICSVLEIAKVHDPPPCPKRTPGLVLVELKITLPSKLVPEAACEAEIQPLPEFVNVTSALYVSGLVLLKITSPAPELIKVKVPSNVLPPADVTLPDPVLVTVTGKLNVEPLKETEVLVAVTVALTDVPAKMVVPEQFKAPFEMLPPLKLDAPEMINVNPERFNDPELIVKLLRPEISSKTGLNVPDWMVTSSPKSGKPEDGDQLAELPHSFETPPIQV